MTLTLHLVRKYLGFRVEEWRALPMWQQTFLLEQLRDDHHG